MADPSSWTAPSDEVQYGVYLGPWVNWSRGGRVLGATLTLESRYGLLLLSFTATFVGFVASRFWRIMTLILHRIYSTPEPRDALHHQRQVVLRNSLSAVSTLWTSLQLAWTWRALADGYIARTLPTIIFAASVFCAFTIAGGFTSSLSTGIGKDVLLDGSLCGIVPMVVGTTGSVSAIYPWASQNVNNAANYAQQCYSSNATGTLDCTTFVRSRFHFSSVLNASCPFQDNICRTDDSNLFLDSGLISTDDLGLNMPSSQRMFYREVLHCAPLRTDGFTATVNVGNNNYTRYRYGSRRQYNDNPRFDWTYEVPSLEVQYRLQSEGAARKTNQGFNLIAMVSSMANGTISPDRSSVLPIPQLIVPEADLLAVFLSPEGVYFLNQTADPWYRGVVPNGTYFFPAGQRHLYIPDEAASPMECVQRFQYCNSRKECGSLAGWLDATTSALTLFHQNPSEYGSVNVTEPDATLSRFMMFQATIGSSTSVYDLITALGPSSLLSSQHLSQGVMGPLPDNQWQLDVTHWFSMRLASLQAVFVNTARGPTDQAVLPYLQKTDNVYQQAMCNNQKILSSDYISVSLFGLYFTYVTGIVVIIFSYAAEPLLTLFYSRRKYEGYKYLEWAANGTLQLQRLAYQGLGSEKWSNYTDDVPKTRPGYFLADLARAYPAEGDNDEVHEVKPRVHAGSTNTPSVSEASTHRSFLEQPRGAPSLPDSAVPEPIAPAVPPIWKALPPSPQSVTPSLQPVAPNVRAVPPNSQAVSPISQSGAA